MSRSTSVGDQRPGGASIHPVADGYLLWRFFKLGLRRITGLPAEASVITTLFVAGVLANALGGVAAAALKRLLPAPPSVGSVVLAGAVVREIPGSLGGAHTRGQPWAGSMIALGLLAPALGLLGAIMAPVLKIPAAVVGLIRRYGI